MVSKILWTISSQVNFIYMALFKHNGNSIQCDLQFQNKLIQIVFLDSQISKLQWENMEQISGTTTEEVIQSTVYLYLTPAATHTNVNYDLICFL